MMPGREDNHPNGEWQLPSSNGGGGGIIRCGPFIWWNWHFSYHRLVPQYGRLPMLNILMHEAYSRGCRKPIAKLLGIISVHAFSSCINASKLNLLVNQCGKMYR